MGQVVDQDGVLVGAIDTVFFNEGELLLARVRNQDFALAWTLQDDDAATATPGG